MPITINGTSGIVTPAGLTINNAPAFSAYQSSAQTLSSATFTKLQFQTEEFDTNSNFDNVTNYRFTPTVAGYYQFTGSLGPSATTTTGIVSFYKNGSEFKRGTFISVALGQNNIQATALVYCNGTTDYVECYGYLGVGQALQATSAVTYFQAALIRTA